MTARNQRGRPAYGDILTPAEWRMRLEANGFLRDEDNSYRPRRLLGVAVEIVPDHSFG